MNNLEINFQNCYGIKSLKHTFEFNHSNIVLIYSPNGVMKSSFAKVFQTIASKEAPQDRIFKSRKSHAMAITSDGKPLNSESVFVIESKPNLFYSEKVSDLIADEKLKLAYDTAYSKIIKSKESLLAKLKSKFPAKKDIEGEFLEAFNCSKNDFLQTLSSLSREIEGPTNGHNKIYYPHVANAKVQTFLNSDKVKTHLQEYISVYEKLLSKTRYLKKGFDHTKATSVHKSLKDGKFFDADHLIVLRNDKQEEVIGSEQDLLKKIEEEKSSILNDPTLQRRFQEIDKDLKNAELFQLREVLLQNRQVVPDLANYDDFIKKVWVSYFQESLDDYKELMKIYLAEKDSIQKIVDRAADQYTDWREVVEIFNRRFDVPFRVLIKNQGDVILNQAAPTISFEYTDGTDSQELPRETLLDFLSTGEQRALYLLNIIFEIESRKKQGKPTLVIADDIADSFDYKNKYAIVEYLKETLEDANFKGIILTHNFDFFRTIQSRVNLYEPQCFSASRVDSEIKLTNVNRENPFELLVQNARKTKGKDFESTITLIPFIRNLIEFAESDSSDSYKLLTCALHKKDSTHNLKFGSFKEVFARYINVDIADIENENVFEKILEAAENAAKTKTDMTIANKIVLSIGIRLRTEEYMIREINDPKFIGSLRKSQTGKLTKEYKRKFSDKKSSISIIDRVNLMTAENIHLNSFMYEPIIDLDSNHLIKLHNEIIEQFK